MTHKARLAQLEKQQPKGRMTWKEFVESGELQRVLDAEEMHDRSMDSLAAALSDMTGEPITGADAEKALKDLRDEPTQPINPA